MRLILPALLLLPALAAAQADEKTKKEYRERFSEIQSSLASSCYGDGCWLESKKMYTWARKEFEKAVRLDPHHEKAQKKLGRKYNPVTDAWETDPELAEDSRVLQKQNEKTGDDELKVRTELEKRRGRSGKRHGRSLLSLGKWCLSNGLEEEGKEALRRSLEYDPTNKTARKDLGFEQDENTGGWFSKEMLAVRRKLLEGVEKAGKGEEFSGDSHVEKALSVSHKKRKSKNFIVESASIDQNRMADLVQHGETALEVFSEFFGEKDVFPEPLNCILLRDKKEHEAFVDAFSKAEGRAKDFQKEARGGGGFPVQWTYLMGERGNLPQSSLQDWVIHGSIQNAARFRAGPKRLWIAEGLAYWFTKNMKQTAHWSCVDLAKTTPGAGVKDMRDPKNWEIQIKVLVEDAEDPDIHEVIKCISWSDFSADETVKGWSIVDFLLREHRERFVKLCAALKENENDPGDGALMEVFGWTPEDLDAKWKLFVLGNY